MKIKFLGAFALLLTLLCINSFAAEISNLTADEVKQMIDKKAQVVIVDARTEDEFKDGHIPQAISIPPNKVETIGDFLPKDKKALIVFYCRGYS